MATNNKMMSKKFSGIIFPANGCCSKRETAELKEVYGEPRISFGNIGEANNCRTCFDKRKMRYGIEYRIETDTTDIDQRKMKDVHWVLFRDFRPEIQEIVKGHLGLIKKKDKTEEDWEQLVKIWGEIVAESVSTVSHFHRYYLRDFSRGVTNMVIELNTAETLAEFDERKSRNAISVKPKKMRRTIDNQSTSVKEGKIETSLTVVKAEPSRDQQVAESEAFDSSSEEIPVDENSLEEAANS